MSGWRGMGERMTTTIYQGDCKDVLPTLPANSIQCVITSPPYWGLRDYSTEQQVWGGDADCEHVWGEEKQIAVGRNDHGTGCISSHLGPNKDGLPGGTPVPNTPASTGTFCQLCGAWRGSLGLEPTVELYVEHLVEIFREVRRVLRDDGVCWLNLGDSFSNKQLQGIPWRVAFALQADSWYLRSDCIWSKPNCMPESVTDRPTKSHEYVFLLSKSGRYFYDADAIREPYHPNSLSRYSYAFGGDGYKSPTKNPAARPDGIISQNPTGRNKRTVWTIPTKSFSQAHFATFPPALVEPMVKAGTSERGCCSAKIIKLRLKRDLSPKKRQEALSYLKRKGLF